ncbi:MAG: hypothetical protein K1X56_01255 [Flavobacteriales bacterium]|nr:hypothetical protein [Flavobacteriales bacterium]
MAGGKETPRQKMIGMMYLVLTALLALNVSKEIVVAFITLNDKLENSTRAIETKNGGVYQAFENFMKVPQTKEAAKPWAARATQIQGMANNAYSFFLQETNDLIKEVEKKDWLDDENGKKKLHTLHEVGSKDDYDAATRLFVGDPGNINQRGKDLVTKFHTYRDSVCFVLANYTLGKRTFKFAPKFDGSSFSDEELLAALKECNPEDTAKIKQVYQMLTLPEKMKNHEEEVPWQAGMFDHAPVVAAAALFTSLRNDIRNAEAVAIDHLLGKVQAPTFNFNKIEPLAFARTSYLNVGDSMDLRVMIAAYDSTEVPKIRFGINDSNPANYKEQIGKISVRGTTPGAYTAYGLISVKEKGEEKWKPWKYQYEVGEPTGVIANEDFLVVYANYEHTFSASASGYPQDRVNLNLPGLAVGSKGGGKFSVKAPVGMIGKKVQSSITVKTDGGGSKSLSGPTFVVKQLPKPSSYLGSIPSSEGNISKADLKANSNAGVRVAYDPSVPLDPTKVSFRVTSFTMVVMVKGTPIRETTTSGALTPKMQGLLNGLSSGMSVSFTAIECVGPGGTKLKVSPLAFIIK